MPCHRLLLIGVSLLRLTRLRMKPQKLSCNSQKMNKNRRKIGIRRRMNGPTIRTARSCLYSPSQMPNSFVSRKRPESGLSRCMVFVSVRNASVYLVRARVHAYVVGIPVTQSAIFPSICTLYFSTVLIRFLPVLFFLITKAFLSVFVL